MSLWTPDGEHDVPKQEESQNEYDNEANELPGFDELSPEEQEQARIMAAELAEARKRVSETPAGDVIANHVMGIYELAAIHLSNQPPVLEEAEVAIDAMTAIVSTLENRLGQNEAVLKDAVQQIQMAYVQIRDSVNTDET